MRKMFPISFCALIPVEYCTQKNRSNRDNSTAGRPSENGLRLRLTQFDAEPPDRPRVTLIGRHGVRRTERARGEPHRIGSRE